MASPAATNSKILEPFKIGTLPSLYLIPDYISPTMEQHFLTNILATRSGWKKVSGRRLLDVGGVVSSKGSLLQSPIPSYLTNLITEISDTFQLYNGSPANHVLINEYSLGDGIMSHQDGPLYFPAVAILSLGSPAIIRFTKKRASDDDEEDDDGCKKEEDKITLGRRSSGCSGSVGDLSRPTASITASVLLPPRSLFIFKDDAYEEYLHGIDFVEEEVIDGSVVNPEMKGVLKENEARDLEAADIKAKATPLMSFKRDGIRVSLTIRRVLRVHSLGMMLRR